MQQGEGRTSEACRTPSTLTRITMEMERGSDVAHISYEVIGVYKMVLPDVEDCYPFLESPLIPHQMGQANFSQLAMPISCLIINVQPGQRIINVQSGIL